MKAIIVIAALALLSGSQVAAHPAGHAEDHSAMRSYVQAAHSDLSACAGADHIEAMEQAALERRTSWLDTIRRARGLHRRDVDTVLKTDHQSKLTGITPSTPASTLFGSTGTCVLQPEVTEGPYWVNGEVVRNDVRENQAGIDLYLDVQVVDIKTCLPVTGFHVDFWHTNSTGVYAGIVANGNGNSADKTNAKTNFHRGIYPVDSDGVVQFISKYPGHYAGRTTHIHVMLSKTGTSFPNNTFLVTGTTHVGQIFFDDTLTTKVEAVSPYSTNKQSRTYNSADGIFKSAAGNNFDPVVNYVLLGSSISQGIFGWIRMAVDTTKTYYPKAAARYQGASTSFTVQE